MNMMIRAFKENIEIGSAMLLEVGSAMLIEIGSAM